MVPSGGFDDASNSWEGAAVAVSHEDLRQALEYRIEKRRYQGEIIGPEELGALLRSICPSMKSTRPTENGAHVRKFVFQPLDVCRREFSTYMGGVDEISWSE